MTNRERAVEILNNICDEESDMIAVGMDIVTFKRKGNEQDGWTLGVCKITIDEKYDELLIHDGECPALYFSYTDFNKMLDYVVRANEDADRQSIIHRLFK